MATPEVSTELSLSVIYQLLPPSPSPANTQSYQYSTQPSDVVTFRQVLALLTCCTGIILVSMFPNTEKEDDNSKSKDSVLGYVVSFKSKSFEILLVNLTDILFHKMC